MSEIGLTQIEAERLIKLEKHWLKQKNQEKLEYPIFGGKLLIPLTCMEGRENFFLDLTRSSIVLTKETKQLRGRQIIPLLRLDIGGPPHRNPDDIEIPSPHLHIYREGYGDKWAIPVPVDKFKNLDDAQQTLIDFMKYCNITKQPKINMELFL